MVIIKSRLALSYMTTFFVYLQCTPLFPVPGADCSFCLPVVSLLVQGRTLVMQGDGSGSLGLLLIFAEDTAPSGQLPFVNLLWCQAKCFTYTTAFKPHNDPMRCVLLLLYLYR